MTGVERIEIAHHLYRALEMQADLMRDPAHTRNWDGARWVAAAFDCQAARAKMLYDDLVAEREIALNNLASLIDERDAAEQALSQAYYLVTGRSPEWSNKFGHAEAVEEIEAAILGKLPGAMTVKAEKNP